MSALDPRHERAALHVISGLGVGGAETSLLRLVRDYPDRGLLHRVLSLSDRAEMGAPLREAGATVEVLGFSPRRLSIGGLGRLWRGGEGGTPAVIQGWMYHGNLGATLAWRGAGRGAPLIWNVRHTLYDLAWEQPSTRLAIRLNAALSRLPRAIVFNSKASIGTHAKNGFDVSRAVLIPNGFDTQQFRPRAEARAALRTLMDVPEDARVVGLVARLDPHKDHATFLRACAMAAFGRPDLRIALIGEGATPAAPEIGRLLAELGVADRVVALGRRSDVAALVPGFDVACLSSRSEAFPNVVGEAMACGVPCVVTDVGEAAWLVADTGTVVPPRDPAALGAGLARMLDLPREDRRALGERARQRIAAQFSSTLCAQRYAALWSAGGDPAAVPRMPA